MWIVINIVLTCTYLEQIFWCTQNWLTRSCIEQDFQFLNANSINYYNRMIIKNHHKEAPEKTWLAKKCYHNNLNQYLRRSYPTISLRNLKLEHVIIRDLHTILSSDIMFFSPCWKKLYGNHACVVCTVQVEWNCWHL